MDMISRPITNATARTMRPFIDNARSISAPAPFQQNTVMQTDPQGRLTIRPACMDDMDNLAQLHYETYYRRFFCTETVGPDGAPYGGPLGAEFPQLIRGQSPESFGDYWVVFLPTAIPGKQQSNYCFVATILAADGERIIGFVKGDLAPLDDEITSIVSRETGLDIDPEKVGELGSLYIDFRFQGTGAGRLLTATGAWELGRAGRAGMVARAYKKNTSPAFFAKTGAEITGQCPIPVPYYEDSPTGRMEKIVDIGGTLLLWRENAFNALCRNPPMALLQRMQYCFAKRVDREKPVQRVKTPSNYDCSFNVL